MARSLPSGLSPKRVKFSLCPSGFGTMLARQKMGSVKMRKIGTIGICTALLVGGCGGAIGNSDSAEGNHAGARAVALPSNPAAPAVIENTVHAEITPSVRSITCHELVGGVPSDETQVYKLRGNELYKITGNTEVLISTTAAMLSIGHSEDDEGQIDSLATQTVEGDSLTRSVFYQRPGKPMEKGFSERFDFKAQTVVDLSDGSDSCHHDGE